MGAMIGSNLVRDALAAAALDRSWRLSSGLSVEWIQGAPYRSRAGRAGRVAPWEPPGRAGVVDADVLPDGTTMLRTAVAAPGGPGPCGCLGAVPWSVGDTGCGGADSEVTSASSSWTYADGACVQTGTCEDRTEMCDDIEPSRSAAAAVAACSGAAMLSEEDGVAYGTSRLRYDPAEGKCAIEYLCAGGSWAHSSYVSSDGSGRVRQHSLSSSTEAEPCWDLDPPSPRELPDTPEPRDDAEPRRYAPPLESGLLLLPPLAGADDHSNRPWAGCATNLSELAVLVYDCDRREAQLLNPVSLNGGVPHTNCTVFWRQQDWDYLLVNGQWWKIGTPKTDPLNRGHCLVQPDGSVIALSGYCCRAEPNAPCAECAA